MKVFLQNNWPVHFKNVIFLLTMNSSMLQEFKERKFNAVYDPGFSLVIKDIIGTFENNLNKFCRLGNSILSVNVNLLVLIFVLNCVREYPYF